MLVINGCSNVPFKDFELKDSLIRIGKILIEVYAERHSREDLDLKKLELVIKYECVLGLKTSCNMELSYNFKTVALTDDTIILKNDIPNDVNIKDEFIIIKPTIDKDVLENMHDKIPELVNEIESNAFERALQTAVDAVRNLKLHNRGQLKFYFKCEDKDFSKEIIIE